MSVPGLDAAAFVKDWTPWKIIIIAPDSIGLVLLEAGVFILKFVGLVFL